MSLNDRFHVIHAMIHSFKYLLHYQNLKFDMTFIYNLDLKSFYYIFIVKKTFYTNKNDYYYYIISDINHKPNDIINSLNFVSFNTDTIILIL